MLNFMTLMFERESAKFQLALLACYINFLAGFCDYLCWKGYAPVTVDAWGQGFQVCDPTNQRSLSLAHVVDTFTRVHNFLDTVSV